MSTRSTQAAPSPASSRKTMPALSALPNTDAPATSRRMSRPDAGLATTPTQTPEGTPGAYDAADGEARLPPPARPPPDDAPEVLARSRTSRGRAAPRPRPSSIAVAAP